MFFNEILEYCNDDYSNGNHVCADCTHPGKCPGNCAECLRQIHFEAGIPGKRHSYDCRNLVDFYVCKYSFKYTSEIIYALKEVTGFFDEKEILNVLSIGCGPCTDLFALDYMKDQGVFKFDKMNYIGVDPLDIWERIHEKIKKSADDIDGINVRFEYEEIQDFLPSLIEENVEADIIIMNYLLSDFHKYHEKAKVIDFLNKLVYYIRKVSPNAVIIINDINLECSRGGGRDYFDMLSSELWKYGFRCIRRHFDNDCRSSHYDYGDEYESNGLFVSPRDDLEFKKFEPFKSCSSAQMIIYKE